MINQVEVLGFRVDIVTPKQAVERVVELTERKGKASLIVTLNSEQVEASAGDKRFRQVVNNADLVVADGAGVAAVASAEAGHVVPRVTGRNILEQTVPRLAAEDVPIFILGGLPGIAERALSALQKEVKENYGGYILKGQAMSGPENICVLTPEDHEYQELSQKVVDSGAGLLACALSSPEGVIWLDGFLRHIERNYKLEQGIVGIVVGGVFDRLAGCVPNAPTILQSCGLEWLYRLYREPSRLPRVFNAVIKFPLMYLHWKFSKIINLHTP